jgi:hypothetical protein
MKNVLNKEFIYIKALHTRTVKLLKRPYGHRRFAILGTLFTIFCQESTSINPNQLFQC